MYSKSRWNGTAHGPLTESAIRVIHNAPERARVSKYTYAAGDEIEGRGKRCVGYVLEGGFAFRAEEGTASFEAGDVFVFGGGNYSLKINVAATAVVIWAWELPQGFQ